MRTHSDFRLNCEHNLCSNPKTHYCSDNDQVLCNSWFVNFHGICNSNQTPDLKDIEDQLDITKSLLNLIQNNTEQLKENTNNKNFEQELKIFSKIFSMINEKVFYFIILILTNI